MSLAIETRGLAVSIGGFALHDVDLRVPAGALVAVLGASGSGKTLLLKLLLGLEHPDAGQRLIFGREPSTSLLHPRLGYLPQAHFLHDRMTAQDALRFTTLVSGESNVDVETMEAVMAAVKLTINPHTYVGALSKSEQQRLLLAKMLIYQPEILLLDEPAAALTGDERQEFLHILRTVSATRTVVYTTAVPADARYASDYMALLHEGKLVAQGLSDDLFQNADYASFCLSIRGNGDTVHQLLVEQEWIHSINVQQEEELSRWIVQVHDEYKAEHGLLRAILADRSLEITDYCQSRPRLRDLLDYLKQIGQSQPVSSQPDAD